MTSYAVGLSGGQPGAGGEGYTRMSAGRAAVLGMRKGTSIEEAKPAARNTCRAKTLHTVL